VQLVQAIERDASTVLEQARTLGLSGNHLGALEVLEGLPHSTPATENWRGLMLILKGDLEAARVAFTNALARGWRGALAGLSIVQRLSGERRDGLLELSERDFEGIDDFDRAYLEREIALVFKENDDFDASRIWLERAWRTALIGPFGKYQMVAIPQDLSYVLGRLGFDAIAVTALDEGLRHSRANRRAPLLYERALRNINLYALEAASEDLEELRVFVPNNPDFALLGRYADARLQHALDDIASARTNFELALYFAALHSSSTAREVALYSCLWLVRMDTDSGQSDRVPDRLERAEGFVRGTFERAWLALRRGRFVSSIGDHLEAAELLREVPSLFAATGARRETGIACLHRAEALLRAGTDHLEEAEVELRLAADIAREIGGANAFQGELEALRNVCWHLETTQGWPEVSALLERGAGVTRVRIGGNTIQLNGRDAGLSPFAARLATFLAAHPCSAWAHLRWSVFADILDEEAALNAFDTARGALESVRGVRVVYRPERHAYSLVWEGVSLER
jgi:tetratricopeptide (TPR) repeat protein